MSRPFVSFFGATLGLCTLAYPIPEKPVSPQLQASVVTAVQKDGPRIVRYASRPVRSTNS